MLKKYCLFLILIIIPLLAGAQIRFEHITSQEGLSQSTVLKIYQDRKQFLWIATTDGLNRYDGKNFTVFRHDFQDSLSLSNNDVNGLFEDSKGHFWVGTRAGGINLYNPRNEKFSHYTKADDGSDISQFSIRNFTERNDTLWVTAFQEGILTKNPNNFILSIDLKSLAIHLYNLSVAGEFGGITAVLKDKTGGIWFGTGAGFLLKWNSGKSFTILRLANPDTNQLQITCLLEDSRQHFWIGTKGQGLLLFDKKAGTFTKAVYQPLAFEGINIITSIFEDQTHTLWIGTDNGILMAKNGNVAAPVHLVANVNKEGSLSSHAVTHIFGDKDNNLWVGLWEAGLNVYYARANKFSNYIFKPGSENSILTNKITGITKDEAGNLLIGTGLGLTSWNRDTDQYKHLRHLASDPASLPGNDINYLFRDACNNIYISVWNKGLLFKSPKQDKFYQFYEKEGFKNKISSMTQGSNGRIWIGTYEGSVFSFDPRSRHLGRLENFAGGNFLLRNVILAIAEDDKNNLWMGSYFGIWKYNLTHKTLTQYRPLSSQGTLSDNHTSCFFKDSKGRIWVGTYGGINLYHEENDSFENFTRKDGLPNEVIKSIQEDAKGNLWIATNSGLCRFNYEKKQVKVWSELDGLKGKEFNVNASFKDENETLFFGSMQGLCIFHPDSLSDTQYESKIYITSLKLLNKPVVAGERGSPLQKNIMDTREFTLGYKDAASVTFEFVELNFHNGQRSQYAYKMIGFDENWNFVGHQTFATYTNLNPGNYTFIVKTISSDGTLSKNGTMVSMTIKPPFYLTTVAYFLYLLVLLLVFYLFRKFVQMREGFKTDLKIKEIEALNIKKLDEAKTNFFINISHELRTPLTLIVSPLQDIIARKEEVSPYLEQQFQLMHKNGQRLMKLINQLLKVSGLETESLVIEKGERLEIRKGNIIEFLEKTIHAFDHLARHHHIGLHFKSNFKGIQACFSEEVVEKCVYNLLANAFKFTPQGGTILVDCVIITASESMEADRLRLTVIDNGIGIPEKEMPHLFKRFHIIEEHASLNPHGTGIGLALIKELVTRHGGTITASSTPGKGTSFYIDLPINKKSLKHHLTEIIPEAAFTGTGIDPDFNETTENHLVETLPRLLLVEDNAELRAYLKESLQELYQVTEAENGKEGLQATLKYHPDVIVSDWMMPEMNGWELCQAVKTNELISHLPFVLLTARSNDESVVLGLNTGADDYITKPFNIILLKARLNALLRNRQALREKFTRSIVISPEEISVTPADEQFLKKIIHLVESHIEDADFDVSALEEALGIGKMTLYRKLTSLTNLSGNAFIRNIRLKRAAQLLAASNYNISEISYMVGFRDPAYLTRCFKKEFGKSPTEFKANLNEGEKKI